MIASVQEFNIETLTGIIAGVAASVTVIGMVVLKVADKKLNGADKRSSMQTQEKIRDVLSELSTHSQISSGSLGRMENAINKMNDELARRPCIMKKD